MTRSVDLKIPKNLQSWLKFENSMQDWDSATGFPIDHWYTEEQGFY